MAFACFSMMKRLSAATSYRQRRQALVHIRTGEELDRLREVERRTGLHGDGHHVAAFEIEQFPSVLRPGRIGSAMGEMRRGVPGPG